MEALRAWDKRLAAAASSTAGDQLSNDQRRFWTNMCICNSLIVERGPEGEFVYQVLRP